MLRFLWTATRGYRLRPWRSPYLRWRIETYCGWKAEEITFSAFHRFVWTRRRDLWRYLRWTGQMRRSATPGPRHPPPASQHPNDRMRRKGGTGPQHPPPASQHPK